MKNLVLVALLALASLGLLMTMGGDQAQAAAPSCGDTLTADTALHEGLTCAGAGLTIGADDITLNCKGHTLTGDGTGGGIILSAVSGVTVKNCVVEDFGIGFFLGSGSNGNTLKGNTATGNTSVGSGGFVIVGGSTGNTLKGNTATGNSGRGFIVSGSSDNTLKGNTATGNGFRGYDITNGSNDNVLKGNVATGNSSAGYVVSGGSTGNVLKGNVSTGSSVEGFAIFSSGNTLKGNTADDNTTFGFRDTTGPANTYIGNTCTGNGSGGSSPTGLCAPQP